MRTAQLKPDLRLSNVSHEKSDSRMEIGEVGKALVGTWSLISCEARSSTGKVERAYGENPFGRLMYGADERMSVLISNPEHQNQKPTLYADADEFDGFLAYCGSFRLDSEESKVIHAVEGSNILSWIGSEQERYFELEGNKLRIRTAPYERQSQEWVATLEWVRL